MLLSTSPEILKHFEGKFMKTDSSKDNATAYLYRWRGRVVKLQWERGEDESGGIETIRDGDRIWLITDTIRLVGWDENGAEEVIAEIDQISGDFYGAMNWESDSVKIETIGNFEELEDIEFNFE